MYNVTTTFLEKIKENNRHIQPYVVIGSTGLDYNQVCEFSIDSSYGDSLPSIGGVVASTLKLKLVRGTPTPEIFTTQDIKPYIKLETSTGVWESIPLGVYKPKIDSIKKTNLTIEIDCMDAIGYSGEIPYNSTLTYPTTTTAVLQEIQEQSGMSIVIPSISATVKTAITGSCRQALAEVAELLSCNAVVDRTGNVVFRYLNNTNFALDANNYMDFKLTSEDTITIGKLRCKKTGEDAVDLTVGSNGFELSFENDNVTTTAELQTIYNRIFPVTYYAYTLTCQGMPHLDVGDKISLTDNKGVTRNLYILSHKLVFNGGLKSEFTAAAPSKDSSGTGSTGNTITGNLKELNIHKQIVEELIAGNITADNIKANSIDATRLKTGTITANSGIIANAAIGTAQIQDAAITNAKILDGAISNAKIGDAEITGAKIANATIGTAKIEQGAITTALIDTGAVGTAQIADGSITDAKIVSLTANKITAGTLDAGEINVVNLNADNITVGTINGQRIADGAITTEKIDDEAVDTSKIKKLAISTELLSADAVTADKIVSGAVTTDKLAAKSVTANKIASNAVTADKIAANAITADKIQAGAITVDKVSSNFGASLDLSSNVAITSKVSQTDVQTAINNIQIGGRNLLQGENIYAVAGTIIKEVLGKYHVKFVNTKVDNTYVIWNKAFGGITVECKTGDSITFSAYYKTNCKCQARVRGTSTSDSVVWKSEDIPNTNGAWQRVIITTTAKIDNPVIWLYFADYRDYNEFGTVEIRDWKLEIGNKATDWTPAPEDVDESIGDANDRIDSANNSISDLTTRISSAESAITQTSDSILTTVSQIYQTKSDADSVKTNLEERLSSIEQTAESISGSVKSLQDNGVDKVVTETGFRFDKDGLTISKTGSAMATNIDDDGMSVRRDNVDVLVADSSGVNALNLTSRQYLIIGTNARFENYNSNRTGCFYIGS